MKIYLIIIMLFSTQAMSMTLEQAKVIINDVKTNPPKTPQEVLKFKEALQIVSGKFATPD